MKTLLPLIALLVVLASCSRKLENNIGEVEGYTPLYASNETLRKISFELPRPIAKAGKIVLYNQLLFQVEQDEGIHVFSVSNPSSPQRIGFIKSAYCKDLAIKNKHLITNNLDDLVVIDISSYSQAREVNRLRGQFPEMLLQHPPETGIYFECPNPEKGFVTGWKKTMLKNPKCSR